MKLRSRTYRVVQTFGIVTEPKGNPTTNRQDAIDRYWHYKREEDPRKGTIRLIVTSQHEITERDMQQ